MKYIRDKVLSGVLDLSQVNTAQLIQWSNETTDSRDMDVLGCEIIYRGKND